MKILCSRRTEKPMYSISRSRAQPAHLHTAKMAIFPPLSRPFFSNISTIAKDLTEALADLDTQDEPNYNATAIKYKVGRITLMRYYKHITRSRRDFLFQSI